MRITRRQKKAAERRGHHRARLRRLRLKEQAVKHPRKKEAKSE